MRNTFINTIIEAAKINKNIQFISGDAGLGIFCDFKENFPEQFLNLGIAEQNMIGFSAGMALSNYKVYVYNIIPFVLYRCYEQVRNDICYQRLPVVLIGTGSGVTYAPQGITHYAVEDLGIVQTLPNLEVFSPADPTETKAVAEYSLFSKNPVYVRLAKSGEKNIYKKKIKDITKPQIIQDGKKVALLFHGSISEEVMEANEVLKKHNIISKIISIPMIQPLDIKVLFKMLNDVDLVYCVEEHFINCGLNSIIEKELWKINNNWKFFPMGIDYKFIHEVKKNKSMRKFYNISAKNIIQNILRRIKND